MQVKGFARAVYLHFGKSVTSKATLGRGGCHDLPVPVDLKRRHLAITCGLFASTSDLLSHHSFGEPKLHSKGLDQVSPNFDRPIF